MDTLPHLNRRLNPSPFDSDYYLLVRLRESLKRNIERHIRHGKVAVFDYGCGDVPYKTLFEGFASLYCAGDIPGNPHADVVLDPSGRVPCEDEKFDVVLSIQVLEHVSDVSRYLSEARRVLKPNGILFLSTHGWWTHHPFPHDYWRWTREGLIKILNENHFEIVGVDWIMGMLAYSYQLRVQCWKGLLNNKGAVAQFFLAWLSFTYQKLMQVADKITPDHVGRDNAAIYMMATKKVS